MQALRVLGMLAEASPSVPSSRARLWPSIRVALEGLGVPMTAVNRCKQLALQVGSDWCLAEAEVALIASLHVYVQGR